MLAGSMVDNEGRKSMFNKTKYAFMLEAPFRIANHCCNYMKKQPSHKFNKESGLRPFSGQMASESKLRTSIWLRYGCNAFNSKEPMSNPMSFWTEQDVLMYAAMNNLELAECYGDIIDERTGEKYVYRDGDSKLDLLELDKPILKTSRCQRTGCFPCLFGIHLEKSPNRLEVMKDVTNPHLQDWCLRGGDFDPEDGLWKPGRGGLGYWFILKWVNVHGGFKINIPNYEYYEEKYGNEKTKMYLEKDA